jgi:hypothetical protein
MFVKPLLLAVFFRELNGFFLDAGSVGVAMGTADGPAAAKAVFSQETLSFMRGFWQKV